MKLPGLGWLAAMLIAPMLACAKQGPAETAVAQVDRIMKARSAAGDFNGAVLVGRHVLYQHAFGFANLEWKPNLKLDL